MLNAYQQTEALRAAIDLDLFTALAESPVTAADLATRIRASERGTRILCDYLTIGGLLSKQDSKYALTPDAQVFLSRKSPAYMGTALQFLCTPFHRKHFSELAETVRRGSPEENEVSTIPENPIWVDFARGMAPLRVGSAEYIAELIDARSGRPWKVLDIAASHGMFGITIAKHNPKAHIVALDWANVLEVTKENARKAGVQDRFSTIAGSAFDADLGSGYDVALVTAFLHHFDPATNEKFLRRLHGALKPGGIVVTTEFVPNEDRVSPPQAAAFSLTMLANTAAGDAYTFSQLDQMFRNAGFSASELHENPRSLDQVILSRK
jgi:2-polyprenyl-3-methyl-5-hydroxy-6-metoxy-1,4-benzoquinol methylase